MFTTFGLKGRPKLFGAIDHNHVMLSQAGEIARRDLADDGDQRHRHLNMFELFSSKHGIKSSIAQRGLQI